MNLQSNYLGLSLKNPLVASSSPLARNLDAMKRMEDQGCAGVVLFSLFEEQIIHESLSLEHYLDYGAESYAEALSYFPKPQAFHAGPIEYLNLIRLAKESLSIPVMASLNGVSTGGWTAYAKEMQEAGADALELNINFIPTNVDESGESVENRYLEIVHAVKAEVRIPVAVKIGPGFSSFPNMAKKLVAAGADGLVLFNRFYQPDYDLNTMEVVPSIVLSSPVETRLPLHWIGILYGHVDADFALTSGVSSHLEVLKAMMAGAKAAMMTSEILRQGPKRFREILESLQAWMEEHEYESIQQMQGSMSLKSIGDPMAYQRANYMKELQSYRHDPSGMGLSI